MLPETTFPGVFLHPSGSISKKIRAILEPRSILLQSIKAYFSKKGSRKNLRKPNNYESLQQNAAHSIGIVGWRPKPESRERSLSNRMLRILLESWAPSKEYATSPLQQNAAHSIGIVGWRPLSEIKRHLGSKLPSAFIISLNRLVAYHSMMVATLPEPTVRPPSRSYGQ